MTTTRRNDIEPLMTPEEVAEYLRVAVGTVKQWVKLGKIPHVKVGSQSRFRREDIEKWTEARAGKAEGADAGAGDVARAA